MNSSLLNRRNLLRWSAAGAVSLPWLNHPLFAQEKYEPLNRYPRMVQDWFIEKVRAAERRKLYRMEKLKTKADAEAYVKEVRDRIRQCFGPEPQRTPLNARVTGVVERDTHRVEKVIFESRPGFPITANLYLPKGKEGPFPGVVGSCGHSSNGKAAKEYQSFAQGLARLGMICLIFDPIGQGERLQYPDEHLKSKVGVGVMEHLHGGNQQFLVGEFFGSWRAWDGIRALDYLLTRPEVDKNHLGITGNSGGGTMTTWLCGVEQRWTMAAPSCFVTTFRRNLENELPADTEQCPPGCLAQGLDHDDFLAVQAPKPVIILAKERDYFDVRGSEEAFARLKKLYALLGAEENIRLFTGPTTHGYTQENREAMYGWFQRAVTGAKGEPPEIKEPELIIETDETLYCTPRGQVSELPGTKNIFQFTSEQSQTLAKRRGQISGDRLKRALSQALRLPRQQEDIPDYRIWRYLGSRGYPSTSAIAYAVTTEPDIQSIVYRLTSEAWYSRPPKASPRAVFYVSHLSSDAELREEPLIKELIQAEPESAFYTCDVRGIGESQPDTCGPDSFHSPYGSDYFYAIHSVMLGEPYIGQKTFDVLRVLQWLVSLGHTEIHLAGKGWGALSATFAAVLSDSVKQVTLKNSLTSYSACAESEDYHWPMSTLPTHVLQAFDLPDCYRELQAKQLRQIDPWGPLAGEEK